MLKEATVGKSATVGKLVVEKLVIMLLLNLFKTMLMLELSTITAMAVLPLKSLESPTLAGLTLETLVEDWTTALSRSQVLPTVN